jgi:glycosyltransferase involved in cell wall biosynthesis
MGDFVISMYLNMSGLSVVGQEYYKLFVSQGFRVIPIWLGLPEMQSSLDPILASEMISASLKPMEEDVVQFHTGRANEVRLLKEKKAFMGSIVLEGNRLNEEQFNICKQMDLIFVPSYFCRNVCVSSGVPKTKIEYLPYPLDTKLWNPEVKPQNTSNKFRFLYMNTWYERKGWDVILRAFWEEFSVNEPVELTVKSYRENNRIEPLEVLIALQASKMGIQINKRAPIVIRDEVLFANDIPSFMKSFNTYVSPHRSEGFGLNPWHSMALGVPVICTNYGGNTDFTKEDTAFLVRVDKMVSPSKKETNIFPHLIGTTWAEPDVMDLRKQMRLCFQNYELAKKKAEKGAIFVRDNYSYERVFGLFEKAMNKHLPTVFDKLCPDKQIEKLARQPSERFESVQKALTLMEI